MTTFPGHWAPDANFGGNTDKFRFGCKACDKKGESIFLAQIEVQGVKMFASPAAYDTADDARLASYRHMSNVHGWNNPWL